MNGVAPEAPLRRRWPWAAVAAAFVALCLAHVHGFSLPLWSVLLDHVAPTNVLFGQPRAIRSDDWAIAVPLALSQTAQRPRFPVFSEVIAYGGVDNRVGYPVPVAHWLTLFRPQVWGYFAGREFGLAWHWWFRVFALFIAFFLALRLLAPGDPWLPACGAAAVVFSPFFQAWALNCEPMAAMAVLAFVAAVGVAFAEGRRAIALSAAALAWTGGCFALGFLYPPFQIPLAYVFVALLGGCLLRRRAELVAVPDRRFRLAVAGAAALVVLAAVALYLLETKPALALVMNTVYPGRRRLTGGDLSPLLVFNNFFTAFLPEDSLAHFGNICEAGAFFFFFPLPLALVLWNWIARKRRPDPLALALGAVLLFLLVFAVFGVPGLVARLTALDRVQGPRTLEAAGIADLLLVFACLAPVGAGDRPPRWFSLAAAGAWAGAMLAAGLALAPVVPGLAGWRIGVTAAAVFALGAALLLTRRPGALALAAVSIVATCSINPVAVGGADYLEDNALSRKIVELDRLSGGRSLWVVYNAPQLANLVRAVGVRALNGLHYYPQFELWNRLDPSRASENVYNRYAEIDFQLTLDKTAVQFRTPVPDVVQVGLNPENPVFDRLGVDFLLYAGRNVRFLQRCANLEEIAALGDKHIFRVRRAPAPATPSG